MSNVMAQKNEQEDFGSPKKVALDLEGFRRRWPAPVLAIWEEGPRYLGVRIEVSAGLDQAYFRPGQYVTLKWQGEVRFFVIAHRSTRGEKHYWEFLIDRQGFFGESLQAQEPGVILEVSAPEGSGFLEEVSPGEAILFCTGSGVATMRPLIEAWLGSKSRPEKISLFVGVESLKELPYGALLKEWTRAGVELYLAIGSSSTGPRFVQELFLEARQDRKLDLEKAHFFLSGAPVMVSAVRATLAPLGIDAERIHTNL